MNKIIMISMLLLTMQLTAQTNQEASGAPIETDNESQIELLAQSTQPIEDASSVKVIVEKNQTIEEYRQRGELILVKVIPNEGVPYFIDPLERENLKGSSRDLINSGVKPVRWVLKEF